MEPRLSARGITQRFGERVVLDGVDLEVPAGRGDRPARTERRRQDDADAHPVRRARARRRHASTWRGRPATDDDRRAWGYMPQERGLYRDMRVLDLLAWIARLHGLDKGDGRRGRADLLEQLGLGDREPRQGRRTSPAAWRSACSSRPPWCTSPELLVLDEPFAGLDPVAVEFLSDVIRDHVQRGRNLLFSSHQLDLVEDLCETITLIHHGRVVLHGDAPRAEGARAPIATCASTCRSTRAWVDRSTARRSPRSTLAAPASASSPVPTPAWSSTPSAGTLTSPTSASSRRACPSCSSPPPARRTTPRDRGSKPTPARRPRRELRESFRRRSLWIVLAILFVGSSVAMILARGARRAAAPRYDVAVVAGRRHRRRARSLDLGAAAASLDAERRASAPSATDRARPHARRPTDKVDLAVVVGDQPTVIVAQARTTTLVALVGSRSATQALAAQLAAAGLDPATIDRASTAPTVGSRTSRPTSPTPGVGRASCRSSCTSCCCCLMIQVANGVAIEKANRISEVLLAVVRPARAAVRQGDRRRPRRVGGTWPSGAIPVVVKAVAGGDLPAGLGAGDPRRLRPGSLLGLVLYLTTAGALGALVERQEEAGSVLTPLSLLLVGTYVLAQSSRRHAFGAVLAIFPFTSPIVMPARIALGEASTAEIVASLVVGARHRPVRRAPGGRDLPPGHRAHRSSPEARGGPAHQLAERSGLSFTNP